MHGCGVGRVELEPQCAPPSRGQGEAGGLHGHAPSRPLPVCRGGKKKEKSVSQKRSRGRGFSSGATVVRRSETLRSSAPRPARPRAPPRPAPGPGWAVTQPAPPGRFLSSGLRGALRASLRLQVPTCLSYRRRADFPRTHAATSQPRCPSQ